MSTVTNTATVLAFPPAPKKPSKTVRRISTSGNITEKECTTRVTERQKYYDRGRGCCRGLYADISPTNYPATFWVKCTTREGKQRPIKVGKFHPTELNVWRAREIAEVLKTQVSMQVGIDVRLERGARGIENVLRDHRCRPRGFNRVIVVAARRMRTMRATAPVQLDGCGIIQFVRGTDVCGPCAQLPPARRHRTHPRLQSRAPRVGAHGMLCRKCLHGKAE